jgi:cytochrome b6-f complex iron-sulfur subunit
MPDPTDSAGTPSPPAATPTTVTATPPTAAAKPPPPAKPAAPAKPPAKGGATRRGFLFGFAFSSFAIAWAALSAALAGMVLGTVRFLYPNVLFEPPSQFKVGPPDNYEDGKVNERFKEQGAWIVRLKDERGKDVIYALSTTCTHLGCTPNWLEKEQKFKCPCHGSGFHITGINFEGPAPRPLERWAIRLETGDLTVDKSKKFQEELGQWTNPESFVEL